MNTQVCIVGAGRMGRGIALSYIFAGIPVLLVDLKERSNKERDRLIEKTREELIHDLIFLSKIDLIDENEIEQSLSLLSFTHRYAPDNTLSQCHIIFEGVPEVMKAKKNAFRYISEHASKDAIVASTTSTFLITDLASLITNPERFLNAHWLNPAHLMPLVEISRGVQTSQASIDTLVASLESIGKVPVVCSASPGYIVPRIQTLAMNEAARLVEERVASAEDVDKAVNLGFGLRFAVLGLLEFIDWGGGDILYYGSNYLSKTLDSRYAAPKIIAENMEQKKNGIRDGIGFFDYRKIDVNHYRQKRMHDFAALLKYRGLLPIYNQAANADK